MNELQSSSIQARILPAGFLVDSRYEIEKFIGAGGMAAVYLAKDTEQNNNLVALKILHKELTKDKVYLERFLREVELMKKISQPNVCRVFDISTDMELVYFTMEYIDGHSLAELMENHCFSIPEIAELIIEICKGLAAIHSLGIMHRDLKPENIMIDQNATAKILDFGVAREKASNITTEVQRVGSIYYMAPELWRGDQLTPAIDLYSLGVVLYELTTGKLPFEADYLGAIMKMHLEETPVEPNKLNTLIPQWLSDLILQLLAKKISHRPTSALAVAEKVEQQFSGQSQEQLSKPHGGDDKITRKRSNTFVFRLSATQVMEPGAAELDAEQQRRKRRGVTVVIPLPRRSAFIFEVERPSKDFIFFGLFLISLQVMDGYLTSKGIQRFGLEAEGNLLLRTLMQVFGEHHALLAAKAFAILLIVFLTVLAKRMTWITNLIGALSYIYIVAAVIPWIIILLKTQ